MFASVASSAGRTTALFLLLLALAFTAGCKSTSKTPTFLIPEEDTAREQFLVAEMAYREARGIYDQKVRAAELRKAIAAYQAVERRFPDDRRYTPAAAAFIGNIHQDLREFNAALAQYEHCLKKYSDDDEVRITALLGMGQSYDELKKPQSAQPYYKMITDEYAGNPNPRIREIVEQARLRYRQIRLIGD